jgi:hypothetical protein
MFEIAMLTIVCLVSTQVKERDMLETPITIV